MRTDQAFAEIFGHRPDWLAGTCGGLDAARRERVAALPAAKAEDLAPAALEFHCAADLDAWLSHSMPDRRTGELRAEGSRFARDRCGHGSAGGGRANGFSLSASR